MIRFRKFIRRVDSGYLVVIAICLLAVWPFLSIPSLPQETDAELHIFRLAELSFLVRGGELYPRWAPNFFHGYGYPIFNYYAPLSYYVGLIFELLPRLDAVDAVKIVFVLGMLLGAIGVYGFVRDYWGRMAGYVAAALFIYAPYIQYIDPHARGVLAESFSFGVFPIALWAVDKLRRRQTAVRWITAVLFTAAVILSHNLMALLFFGILGAWLVWQLLFPANENSDQSWKALLLPGFALVCGLAVAAFFWLPVLLEQDAVNLNTLIGEGDNYDFHTHFLSLREMLSPSLRLDWGATEPLFRFNLGVGQWIVALNGLFMLLWRKTTHQKSLWFFMIGTLILTFLMLPVSAAIWETIPFLPFFQFPWRLLGPTAVFLAILGGAGISAVVELAKNSRAGRFSSAVPAIIVAGILLLSLPLSQPTPWPDFAEVNVLRMSLIERSGRWLGTTSTADYVPATVDTAPARNRESVLPLYDGLPIDRINWATTPAVASIAFEQITPLHFQYTISSPKEFMFRLFLFQFPGWEARINGEIVQIELGRPEGFIVIPMPAGENQRVDVEFGTTPARTMAFRMTFTGLLFLLLVAVWLQHKGQGEGSTYPRFSQLDRGILGVVGGVTAVAILLIHPTGWLHHTSSGDIVQPSQVQAYADFGGQIAMLGYDVSTQSAKPSSSFDVTLYWKLQQPQEINYQSYVHVLKPDGSLLTQSDHLNPGEFPTRRWPEDKYVRDTHTLQIPADALPGEYWVVTGLWVQSEGWRLPLFDENGSQIRDNFPIIKLKVNPIE